LGRVILEALAIAAGDSEFSARLANSVSGALSAYYILALGSWGPKYNSEG